MSRNLSWVVGLLILFALGVGALYYVMKSNPSAPANISPYQNPYSYGTPGTVSTTGSTSPSVSSVPTTYLPTASGGTIVAHDPTQDPSTKTLSVNPGHYYLGNAPDPSSSKPPSAPYIIEYIASTHYFGVELTQEPIGQARIEAEQYLMQHLGITQDQMCQLKYMVSVPWYVNQVYTGENLGFSFCPGAVALPQ